MKFKTGDKVIVIAGANKGKTGNRWSTRCFLQFHVRLCKAPW